MALDPELRALLEALNAKMDAGFAEAAARDVETRETLRAEMKATRAVAEAALQVAVQARDAAAAANEGVEAARTEARALHEDTWKKIEGMKEGLSTHERAEADRLDAVREEAMLNGHVLPLEASAANHEGRLNDHENRIRAVEHR